MKKHRKPNQFLNEAYYKGGNEALGEFIRKNLIYPEEALKEKAEGSIKVKFDINHKGKVIEAIAIDKIGLGFEEEAIRVVKLLRYECNVPRGMKAIFHKELDIHFKLPPKKKATSSFSYQYTTPAKKKEEKLNKNTYSYKIKLK